MKKFGEFKLIIDLLKEEKNQIITASILVFICELFIIFAGYLNGAAVESITKMNLKLALLYLAIYLVIDVFIITIIYIKSESMLKKVENRISKKIGLYSYTKALDLPAYAYENISSGEIINRVTNDPSVISDSFHDLLEIASSLIGSFLIIIYIFYNSFIVGIEIILFVCILFLILKKYNKKLKKINEIVKKQEDKYSSIITETTRGIREIKTLGVKTNIISDVKKIISNLYNKTNEEIDVQKEFDIITRIIKVFLEIIVYATCIVLIYYGKSTITFFVAMTYYVYRYMYLIENFNHFSKVYQKIVVSFSRINEILENKLYEDEKFGNVTIKKPQGYIEFRNVTFGYPNEDIILKNFNLKIEPNKKIAIVGKSGQGKTTIFNLLTRVFDPIDGKILLDDVDIKDLTEKDLRKHISIIRQEPFIFNRTIKENFKMVNPSINSKKMKEYTHTAYLDDYIESLPEKYNTKLGEGGVNLSGGQKQRLAIARTLIKESKVILFDEATSSLDNNSQEYIKKAIDNLVKDHTVIIVAHRLSTIIDSDVIYVINKGKIVASGTHNQLLEESKIYRDLYNSEI